MSEFWIGVWVGFSVAAIASTLGNVLGHRSSKKLRPTNELIMEFMESEDYNKE